MLEATLAQRPSFLLLAYAWAASSHLEPDLLCCTIAEFSHPDVLAAETLGIMCSPFNCDFVIQIGPRWMVLLYFALLCDNGHEFPGFCEGGKGVVSRDALVR